MFTTRKRVLLACTAEILPIKWGLDLMDIFYTTTTEEGEKETFLISSNIKIGDFPVIPTMPIQTEPILWIPWPRNILPLEMEIIVFRLAAFPALTVRES